MKSKRYLTHHALPKRNALVVALALGMGISGLAYGQATSGTIFGNAPAGDTVQVTSATGVTRSTTVNANGSYSVTNLPLGTYTVTLMDNGQTVSSRNNVGVQVGAGVAVSFSAASQNAQNLGAVQVTANALPSIDVTSVTDTTIITAAQLKQLPLGRSSESIALLTPGTVRGSGYFGNITTFGGSSGAENAYYVNGYNTGDLYTNIGGFDLPYGAIAQQQTMSGGFSAKYGRSDGGVISQTGKRGTNEWHFGGQIVWEPRHLMSSPKSNYYPYVAGPSQEFCQFIIDPYNPANTQCDPSGATEKYSHESSYNPGSLYNYNGHDKSWTTVYTAYLGGPIIKDKLFFFVDAEVGKTRSTGVSAVTNPTENFYAAHHTDFYGKLDWNINDSNIFEFTYLQHKAKSGQGATYNYDYDTNSATTFKTPNDQSTVDSKFLIAHYTSYITDNATLSVLYGHADVYNPTIYGYKGNLPLIGGGSNQDPAVWAALEAADPTLNINSGSGIISPHQTNASVTSPDSALHSHGLRADFTYVAGNHTLGIGIDNMTYTAQDQGTSYTGGPAPAAVVPDPGHPDAPLDGTYWLYTTSGPTYIVRYRNISNLGGMKTEQKAWYVMDTWQVTPTFQLNIGLRNDHFINYTNVGQEFVNLKNQWEPRLGASWDVFGDSSFKVYGNAGRYYLALPQNAANRAANSSVFLQQYFTYTSIDPKTGEPLGLAPFTSHISSPDGEYGNAKDPKQTTSRNLKPMYIDQFNLGFDKKLGDNWQYGAKLSYRELKATIDDECQPGKIAAKMTKMGLDPNDYLNSLYYGPAYCRLINPGKTSDMVMQKDSDDSYTVVPMTFADWGYPQKPSRKYKSINVYFEHPFDGKWFARADLTYAKATGNTAGQIRPDFGQADVSKTEDWDSAALMVGQDGELLNTRKWYFRLRGAYQITPEWLVSTTTMIASGTPQECLGYSGPDALGDDSGYNYHGTGNYHWCAGQIVHPGSDSQYAGHTPWTHIVNLGVTYAPAFADHKLAFKLFVFNALNEQKPTQTSVSLVSSEHTLDNFFHYPVSRTPARYVRLSVSYDY